MIKIADLRVGNFILEDENLISRVNGFTPYGDSTRCDEEQGCLILIDVYRKEGYIDSGFECESSLCNPMPLTEDWLVNKFGFEVVTDREYGGYLSPEVNGQQIRIRVNTLGIHFYTPNKRAKPLYIDYVHELQNLIFVLTKTELSIK